jgi:hypothetical protein
LKVGGLKEGRKVLKMHRSALFYFIQTGGKTAINMKLKARIVEKFAVRPILLRPLGATALSP